MPATPLPTARPEDRDRRRAAALLRLRDTARADGVSPARIAELESALTGAFAINDMMSAWFGQARD